MKKIKAFLIDFGWPRIIIAIFLLSLFIASPIINFIQQKEVIDIARCLGDLFTRFGMNAVLVLALVPMVQSGCGLNFGLPLGIISGLLGATLSIQFGLTGFVGVFGAMIMSLPFSIISGFGYGNLLNRVKGDEMIIATYVGFSSVMFMNILWLILPYTSPNMVQAFAGKGLRVTIATENYWLHQLSNFLAFKMDSDGAWFFNLGIDYNKAFDLLDGKILIPTGMILFFAICALLMWLFFKSKTGTAMTAVGSNPDFARASGISVNRMRTISTMISTAAGGIGIIIYAQSFGWIQLYSGPLYMAFPAVAALLIGGASVNKASILNVIIGTFLFQGILTMTPSVINSVLQNDMSEVIRIIVSNGMILYALTRKTKAAR